jgi:hypothetical protein
MASSIILLGIVFLCAAIVIIVISLVIGLLLSFCGIPLIYKFRGVARDKRRIGWGRKIVLSIPLAMVTGILISVGTFLFMAYGNPFLSAQQEIFQDATDLALPPSVRIIDSENSALFDVSLWLHFTALPQDVTDILASDNYVEQKNFNFDFSSFTPPAWWQPESLGTNVRYYECQGKIEGGRVHRKYMFVNVEINEVFFFRY